MLKSISNYLVKFFAVIRNILAAICNLMLKCIGCVLVVLLHIGKAVANIIISSYLIVLMFVTLISVGVVVFALESWIISSIAASNGVVDNVIKPVTFVITLIGCCAAIYNFFKKIGNEELNPLLKKMYALSCELNKKAPKKVDELYAEIIVDINKTCNENVISKFNGFKTLRSRKAKKELVDELIISVIHPKTQALRISPTEHGLYLI